MQVNPKDFIIALVNTKPTLLKVTESSNDKVTCFKEASRFYKKEQQIVSPEDILVNLGADPYAGMVYGNDTSFIYRGKIDIEHWGRIAFFKRYPSPVIEGLKKAFAEAYEVVKQYELEAFIPDTLIWKIVSTNKRYSGCYAVPKDPKIPLTITLNMENIPEEDAKYVILHEFFHHVHHLMEENSSVNMQWLKLYSLSIHKEDISLDDLQFLWGYLEGDKQNEDHERSPRKLSKALAPEDKPKYLAVLRWIKQVRGVSPKELDLAWLCEDYEFVENLWPSSPISCKDIQPLISDYACKSFKETFAEGMSYYVLGKSLPKCVKILCEKTLAYLKVLKRGM